MHSNSEVINNHGLISEQIEIDELEMILDKLQSVLESGVDGAVCEFGCFAGTTSLFLQRTLESNNSNKKLYLYDSFEGLPEKSLKDHSALGEDFVPGELMANKSQLKLNFKKANLSLRNVKIKKGWFSELKNKDLPKHICFAFMDGDFYDSIKDSLELVKKRVAVGGIVVIDDFNNPALPGAKKAVSEFLESNKSYSLIIEDKSLAVLEKS